MELLPVIVKCPIYTQKKIHSFIGKFMSEMNVVESVVLCWHNGIFSP